MTTTAKPTPQSAWLDAQYNNRALVPDFAAYFARWQADSAAARAAGPCVLDVPYGSGAGETLDVFPAQGGSAGPAPVLFFIHGGYWRSLDKADHSFVAPAFTRQGVCVVVVNYALCPGTPEAPVTVPQIALQMARALAWTWRHIAQHGGDPARITVAGHSAGGHLAAMLMACDGRRVARDLPARLVQKGVSVSGLYELDTILRTPYLQTSLHLTPAQVRQCSPAWYAPPRGARFISVAGGDESSEYHRHNALIGQRWGARCVPVCELLPGRNHFSMLDALVEPGHRLHQQALELVRS